MPRPKKTFRRMKVNAAAAYKRGEREEAYKLWEKAAAGVKEHYNKKHVKAVPEAEASEGEATEGKAAQAPAADAAS